MNKLEKFKFRVFTVSIISLFYYSKYAFQESGSKTLFIISSIIVAIFIVYLIKDGKILLDVPSTVKLKGMVIKIYNIDKILYIILLSIILNNYWTDKMQHLLSLDIIFLLLVLILSIVLINIRIVRVENGSE